MKASKPHKVRPPETEKKMEFLINPKVASIFVVAAVMLLIITILYPKSVTLKIAARYLAMDGSPNMSPESDVSYAI